ncbi:mercuric reductase [Rhodopirellula sp. JC740]|uniref:Mercuric reductase n=1 Tax=Rhodopirellula halodulae TaxID=2894198 RepID=A0ABS8NH44_9BACT|nr:mercuric reductase [Rhodopirellula sp. JC740]MCC9642888.1 mercuric reductase [Rhodopirellula sp. JC740]
MNALQPHDEFNQQLQSNVHPDDWQNPTPDRPYHLVVIGAGTAGLVTAAGAAGLGARVALIERDLMGGDCLNVGCVPSKALISAARVASQLRHSNRFHIEHTGEVKVDFAQVMRRMRKLRAKISRNDSAERFRELGVDVYFGQASFVDDQTLKVGETQIPFKRAVIATGARAAAPSISGLDQVDYLTNESLFSLTELPKRLGVIGAGPIGCEMAQAFAQLGAEVLLIESGKGILSKEDRDAAEIVRESMLADGVRLLSSAKGLTVRNDNGIRISLDADGTHVDEPLDQLLVAAGRAPNVEHLCLDEVGVRYDRNGIQVNDQLRTANPNIFAAGDVCSRYQFTHVADFHARIVIQNALFAVGPLGQKKVSDLIVPWATYTTPEVAHVGLHEHEAEADGTKVDVFVQRFDEVDRAILEGEENGFVKVLTEKGTDKILGATIVAGNAGDMISEITLAMNNGIGLGTIASSIHPYPTQAEAIRKLGDQFNRTRLTTFNQTMLGYLQRLNVGQ